eukprot:UN20782
MCHFYSPCFEYLENAFFFLQVIQTQFFVSQGNIKFDKKEKFKFCKLLKAFCMNLSHIIGLKSYLQAFHQDFAR